MKGERFVGWLEPTLEERPPAEIVSLLADEDEESDDGCTGWMWNHRRSKNTTIG